MRYLAIVLTAYAFFLSAGSVAAREVRYVSPFKPGNLQVSYDLERKRFREGVHIELPVEVCGAAGEFDCLLTEFSFALSVPRKGVPNGTTWKIGRYKFTAIGGGPMRVSGRDLNATIIDTVVDGGPDDRPTVRAVYDPKYGIVAYSHLQWQNHPQTNIPSLYPTISEPSVAVDLGLWVRAR